MKRNFVGGARTKLFESTTMALFMQVSVDKDSKVKNTKSETRLKREPYMNESGIVISHLRRSDMLEQITSYIDIKSSSQSLACWRLTRGAFSAVASFLIFDATLIAFNKAERRVSSNLPIYD